MKVRSPFNWKKFYMFYPTQMIFGWLWNFCENNHIPLGKYPPFVFGKMIGAKGKSVKEDEIPDLTTWHEKE